MGKGWLVGALIAIIAGAVIARFSVPHAPPADVAIEGFIPSIPDAAKLRHEHHLRRIASGPVDLAIFGDSILRGWEDHDDLWDRLFQRRNAGLFATTGDTTSNLLWRLDHGEAEGYRARWCMVMIGTNNRKYHTAQETALGIAAVVKKLREKQPGATILLLGLMPNSKYEDEVNSLITRLADGKTIHIRQYTPQPDDRPDGIHFSRQGYVRWADWLEREFESLGIEKSK